MAARPNYVSTYESSPIVRRSALASPRYGSSTPTLDASRYERAQRTSMTPAADGYGTPSMRSAMVTSSYGAAVAASPAASAYGAGSPTIGEGVPPSGSQTSRTAQLNMSMLERKVQKLEDTQGRIAGEVRAELHGLFSDRIRTLETTVSEAVENHSAELTRQQSHFDSLCSKLERSMADLEGQLKQSLTQQGTALADRCDELSTQTKTTLAFQQLDTEKSLQDYGVKLAKEIRELDGALIARIDRNQEALDTRIETEARTINEKYGDVCVGIDNKLSALFEETSTRKYTNNPFHSLISRGRR